VTKECGVRRKSVRGAELKKDGMGKLLWAVTRAPRRRYAWRRLWTGAYRSHSAPY